jgi:hypothetical protein
LNGKYKIVAITAHPTDGRKNTNCSGKHNHQNGKIHVKHSTVSKSHTKQLPPHTVYSNKKTTLQLHTSQRSFFFLTM